MSEKQDLVAMLDKHRGFLRHTAEGLSDEQARATPTVSALCVGGLIKHVAMVEQQWTGFISAGAAAFHSHGGEDAYANSFRLLAGETLAAALEEYARVAAATHDLVNNVDLDDGHALPAQPWFESGASWSNRRVLMHILAETAQHAGHADIIREAIDGHKTMSS